LVEESIPLLPERPPIATVAIENPLVHCRRAVIPIGVDVGLYAIGKSAGDSTLKVASFCGSVAEEAREHEEGESKGQVTSSHTIFPFVDRGRLILNAVLILPLMAY
jgi:hypothetical protein